MGIFGKPLAINNPASEKNASIRKINRGPKCRLIKAPIGSASMGPIAMMAREVPERRAAPPGSEVASAWVDRFNAPNVSPHPKRRISNHQNPEMNELPSAHSADTRAASITVGRSPCLA